MKLTVRRIVIAVFAVAAGCVPAIALAQTSFPGTGSAAGTQYGGSTTTTGTTTTPSTTTTTTTTPSTTTTTTTPGGGGGAGGAGNGNGNNGNGNGNGGGNGSNGGGNGNGNNGNGNGNGGGNGAGNSSGSGNGGGNSGGNANSGSGGGNAGSGAGGSGLGGAAGFVNTENPNSVDTSGLIDPDAPYAGISLSPLPLETYKDAVQATGPLAYIAEIHEPLGNQDVAKLTEKTAWKGAATDNKKLAKFSKALGKSVVQGGPLAKKALPVLADGVTPRQVHPVSGFLLTHVHVPLKGAEAKQRDVFVKNFIKGMKSVAIPTVKQGTKISVPIVGIETLPLKKSTVPFFKQFGISTVDDVDTASGKTSVGRVLNGAKGHFGQKKVSTDGKVAKRPKNAAPLLYRPTASYQPGEQIRDADGGIPGGERTTIILLALALLSTGAVLGAAQRRARALRARSTTRQ